MLERPGSQSITQRHLINLQPHASVQFNGGVMMKVSKIGVFLFLLAPLWALAAFPVGQWVARYYDINTGALYSTHGICIKSDGTWHFTSLSRGGGNWFVKGSNVLIHGQVDDFNPVLNEAANLTTSNWTVMTGYWQEWRKSDGWNLYLRTNITFQSPTCS
jgi:hypothetical protein